MTTGTWASIHRFFGRQLSIRRAIFRSALPFCPDGRFNAAKVLIEGLAMDWGKAIFFFRSKLT
jgi:hypothetical protein